MLLPKHRDKCSIAILSMLCFCVMFVSSGYINLGVFVANAQNAGSAKVRTWWHENGVKNAKDSLDDGLIRQSPFYSTKVASVSAPERKYDSFTYLSIPRDGKAKVYEDPDGADFAFDAGLSMSWSSFEYADDVFVDVSLDTGQHLSSVNDVVIRPVRAGLHAQLIDDHTVRIHIPYSEDGYRLSVEFAPQMFTSYNDRSPGTGNLTENGGAAISHEPRNAMLLFAQPMVQETDRQLIPDKKAGGVHVMEPGQVTALERMTAIDTLYFGPGTYWMGSSYHAKLPKNIRWIYLSPGAYVKGAFQFLDNTGDYRITGYGVLSGEQYVYEADTENGYRHRDQKKTNCHGSCVKMLQFESAGKRQNVELQGVTIANPPYHTFVMYGQEDGPFAVHARNYQQVGGWYWQTDGLELYRGSSLKNSFFHANDDVFKLYHSDVSVSNNVVWKNENGPVFQWGWAPKNMSNVTVKDTDIIHNRMYWGDIKDNSCIFNAAPSWSAPNRNDTADGGMTVQGMSFINTNVEGMVNCAIRVSVLQNMRDIVIDGFHIDAWNELDPAAQRSMFKVLTDADGRIMQVGTEGHGMLLHNYTVAGVPIVKGGDSWAAYERGRLDFPPEVDPYWDATADGWDMNAMPSLVVRGIENDMISTSRVIDVSGSTDGSFVGISVNEEDQQTIEPHDGVFKGRITLPGLVNRIRITASSPEGRPRSERITVLSFGELVGSLPDPEGDDHGPGTYTYPADGAFNEGSFDMLGLEVYKDGESVRFVVPVAASINNPWGGNGMSTQRLNIYLGSSGTAVGTKQSPLLPGTNAYAETSWLRAIVADGRNDSSPFSTGVYEEAEFRRVGEVALDVVRQHYIVASVPAETLKGIDLEKMSVQVLMLGSSEDGEGVGNVRPVYSSDCWNGFEGCPSYIHDYRFGGGLGVLTDTPERDTVTTDSNAMDILADAAEQASLMDLGLDRVVLPFRSLKMDRKCGEETTPINNGEGDSDPEKIPKPHSSEQYDGALEKKKKIPEQDKSNDATIREQPTRLENTGVGIELIVFVAGLALMVFGVIVLAMEKASD